MTPRNSVYDSDENSDHASSALLSHPIIADYNNTMKDWDECYINRGSTNELLCQAYKYCWWKVFLTFLGTAFSGGFLLLIFYWRSDWKLLCTCSRTKWKSANKVYLKTTDDSKEAFVSVLEYMQYDLADLLLTSYPKTPHSNVSVTYGSSPNENNNSVLWFKHRLAKYIWNEELKTFVELEGLSGIASLSQLHNDANQLLSSSEIDQREKLFGSNVITVKIPSYFHLLVGEILNPFYVFQLFAVIFWSFDEYYIYASAIFVISLISAVVSLIQVRMERVRLHDMVHHHNEIKVDVIRKVNGDPEQKQIWSKKLVPGDVIVIPQHGAEIPCDAVLISGTCIVNESMLTGESIPVTKTPLPQGASEIAMTYDAEDHKRHTLFCGTEVLQTRFYRGELVKAVVVQSGFHTAKGQLVHSILFPKPIDLKLLRDAYRFVGILFMMAMAGFIYTVVIMVDEGETARDIFFNAVDLITISVPPALPLALTIGIVYAQLRLKRQKIHCLSPQRINISGQIDVVAFDKTGTLTEDGLDMYAVVPVNHTFPELVGRKFLSPIPPNRIRKDLTINDTVLHCMATCHTLTSIDDRLTGDPLDVKMFEATEWRLIEPAIEDESKYDQIQSTFVRPPSDLLKQSNERNELVDSLEQLNDSTSEASSESSGHDIGIVRQFPFSSSLQRCSVIVKPYKSSSKDLTVFLKGAPETVAQLCRPESLPCDFQETLKMYTMQGFRMIGLAYKPIKSTWLKAQKLERQAVECELVFLGLIALENKLKPQSSHALTRLHKANIRTLMVTGDNLLTSLSVARESGLVGSTDSILVASTTPPSPGRSATLTWSYPDRCAAGDPGSLASSFSSAGEKVSKNNRTVSICMGEQIPAGWHLAVSGKDFEIIREYFPEWLDVLAAKGSIFARMSPSQKTCLIEALQDIDYHVCMCGDGANDCGALKRAHAGVSLSEYEASVAAPFTSHTDLGIECVPTLIREGRAALVTSFGVFKFMALYSVIQFSTVTILYNKSSNLGDLQYLYIDLIVIDLIALTMSRNHAHKTLHKRHPPTSLVSAEVLVSLIFQIVLQCAVQVLVYFFVQDQCWYTDDTPTEAVNKTYANVSTCPPMMNVPDQSHIDDDFKILTYSNSALFIFSSFLYMSVSIAFSQGRPFRTPIYKNYFFVLSLLILLLFNLFVLFLAPQSVNDFLMIRTIPDVNFELLLLIIAAAHFVIAVAFEMLIVEQHRIWCAIRRKCACYYRNHVSKRYKTVLNRLEVNSGDPDLGDTLERGDILNPLVFVNKSIESQSRHDKLSVETKTQL